jgi:hypothetical protein
MSITLPDGTRAALHSEWSVGGAAVSRRISFYRTAVLTLSLVGMSAVQAQDKTPSDLTGKWQLRTKTGKSKDISTLDLTESGSSLIGTVSRGMECRDSMHVLLDKRLRLSTIDWLGEASFRPNQSCIVAEGHYFVAGLLCQISHQHMQGRAAFDGGDLTRFVTRNLEDARNVILFNYLEPNCIRPGLLSELELRLGLRSNREP